MQVSNLKDWLLKIRKRPGMYLNPVNILSLNNFFIGYSAATLIYNIDDCLFDNDVSFHDWVAMMQRVPYSSAGWANLIHENSKNGEEGLKTFFAYYDLYCNRQFKVIEVLTIPENKRKLTWKTVSTISSNGKEESQSNIMYPHKIMIGTYIKGHSVFVRYLDVNESLIEQEEYFTSYRAAKKALKSNELL